MSHRDRLVHFVRGDARYYINIRGEVTYTSPTHNLLLPTQSWRVVGAVEFGRGRIAGNVIRSYTLDDILHNRVPWFFKNGKQRCFVKDYDHGGYRVWMSPSVRDVWIESTGYVPGGEMNPFRKVNSHELSHHSHSGG